MLYRLLLISIMAASSAGCFWDDYETARTLTAVTPPTNDNETLPDNGLVGNGNLEEDEATGWSWEVNAGAATFELSEEQYYSGRQSLRTLIEAVGPNWGDITAGPAAIEVEEGNYFFSGWVLGTNGAVVNFVVHPTDDPETVLASQQVEVTSGWQRVGLDVVVPAGVTSLDLPVQMSSDLNLGAVIFLDNFSLKVSGGAAFIEIPIGEGLPGWSVDQATNTLSYDPELGLVIDPDPANTPQVAMYTMAEPIDPAGLIFTYVINYPQEYKDAGIAVQPYIQEEGDDYTGDYSGYVGSGSLEVGTNVIEYEPTGDPIPLIQRIGFQVIGNVEGLEVGTGISISRVFYPGAGPSDLELPLDSGWDASNGSAEYVAEGVTYSPAAADDNLLYIIQGPVNLEGATMVFTVDIDQDFKDSGADLQPYAQQNFGSYTGYWSCYIGNADLTVGSAEYTCTVDNDDGTFNIADGESVRVGFQAKNSPAGTVTVTDARITF